MDFKRIENRKIKICHIANTDTAVRFLLMNQLRFLLSSGFEVYVVCSEGKFVQFVEEFPRK